jgi:DNA-binding transcriptional LysR family regulator
MNLAALQIFKTVADEGGVNRAARKLNRVQSNVTTRVKQLESELGTRLFEKRGRGLVLSPSGKVLLDYADRMLRLSSEAQAALRSDTPRGVLKFGALESTAATRLPPILAAFHKRHPDVTLEMVTGTSGALVARVQNYEVEAALVAEPFNAQGLETKLAFVERLVLIAPRGHRGIRELRAAPRRTLIAFAAGCSYRRTLETWLGSSGLVADRVMEFGSYHAIVACVAAGTGVATVPESVVRALNAERNVAIHPLPAAVARARTMLVWRPNHRSAALDALQAEILRTR